MMEYSAVGAFFVDLGKHPLLSAKDEKEIFGEIDDIRLEILHVLNQTYVICSKLQVVTEAVKIGCADIKVYIATYKHPMKFGELKPFLNQCFLQYVNMFVQYQDSGDAMCLLDLDIIALDIKFTDTFIMECAKEVLTTKMIDADDFLWLEQSKLSEIQQTLERLVTRFRYLKTTVVECNLKLVVSQAQLHNSEAVHHGLMDLIQEGSIGLMHSVDRFDITAGNRFSTLATWWIRQSIVRALQNDGRVIRVPVTVQDQLSKISKYIREFEEINNRKPTDEEISHSLGLTTSRIRTILNSSISTTSTDVVMNTDSELTLGDILPDEDTLDAFDQIHIADTKTLILDALQYLPKEEQAFINDLYGLENDELSHREVSSKYNIPIDFVRVYEERILSDLKDVVDCL